MAQEIISMGAVVAGACDLQLKNVCMYPNDKVGALLVFQDKNGRQISVCKKCADMQFSKGEWYREGDVPPKKDDPISRLNVFISEFNSAVTDKEKIEIGQKHKDEEWIISVPISAGVYNDPYWVSDINLGSSGYVRIAFESEDESTPAVVEIRPCISMKEYTTSGGAPLFVKKRIR